MCIVATARWRCGLASTCLSVNVVDCIANGLCATENCALSKYEARSDQAKQYRHLYGRRWRNYRDGYLRQHPLCVMCQREGKVTPATVVDHITDHKGDLDLFWDPGNHQPLCTPHHDRDKQAETHKGFSVRVGDDGYPVDPRHPAAR